MKLTLESPLKPFRVIYETGAWMDTLARDKEDAINTVASRARSFPQFSAAIQSVVELPENEAAAAK